MKIYLNGQIVPEEAAVVSVLDRGFLYGDGLFETFRVINGRPFRWPQHWERLEAGARFLALTLPFSSEGLLAAALQLIQANAQPDAVLRLTVSRGIGRRGYSPKGAVRPTVVMTLHPSPGPLTQEVPRWRLVTSSFRLPANEPLAQFKTCNKLPQILARAEADAAGAEEALLTNTEGCVVEGASSNLFWVQDGEICTPPLMSGILAGVTRSTVLELCKDLGLATRQSRITPKEIYKVEGVFVSLSTIGIAEAQSLDGTPLRQSAVIQSVYTAYLNLLRSATAEGFVCG